ncbi:MAG: hypothetical protein HRJ53_04900 [Acidobacteria bacterium Pan2503]|uniref:Uncharacterized protein n=1 Tax=Candidatus Acidiferrum panamense TaxID=2741543 RepID=A0A7V8SVL8_9BACT|nr:hypothetical protein [Candidatus Acidoferrum panamensis]
MRFDCKLGKHEGGEYLHAGMWYSSYDEFVYHRCLTPYQRHRDFGRAFKPLPASHWQRPRAHMMVRTYFGEYDV